ncbi:MAG TPA: sigma-54 dependent transcriptional regulator, partial [Ramlibacter sp.]
MNTKRLPRLCLVEDDQIMGESLADRFRLEGFEVDWHRRAGEAHRAIGRVRYDLVLTDVRLPDFTGEILYIRLLEELGKLPPFLFITGYGSIERAVALLKAGAADYVTKPFELDELVLKVRQLCRDCPPADEDEEAVSLGVSPAMRKVEAVLRRVADHAATVLVTGESGVGKEYVALQLHRYASGGAPRPFVAVNCGAITETLIEAELFGHEKGAFTGAARQRKGVFEQAHGGTLFLDEIGDMPLAMQVKLLRAIQERRIVRVGGEAAVPVDVRIICATNQELKARVEAGAFREDLFYRINVVHVRIPLLRERCDDILWFARRFLREFAQLHGGPARSLSPAAEQALIAWPWPGNLRELRHCIERACILSAGPVLQPQELFEHPPGDLLAQRHASGTLEQYIRDCERCYIQRELQRSQGQIATTAARLGISRKNLWEKMK